MKNYNLWSVILWFCDSAQVLPSVETLQNSVTDSLISGITAINPLSDAQGTMSFLSLENFANEVISFALLYFFKSSTSQQ